MFLEYRGKCPICEKATRFFAYDSWLRDHLLCESCPNWSIPRERALALVLSEVAPGWREMRIHESSPSNRGISVKLQKECTGYVGSQFFANQPLGAVINGFRNENLERQTFGSAEFDIVVTLDVLEHVYEPKLVCQEINRTLKPGGVFISTFPIGKGTVQGWSRRFELLPDGSRKDIRPPEYHGNPIDPEGSIVTVDYGYDVHQALAEWGPFDVRICRFNDRTHGIIGEYTEVVVCRKASL